MIQHRSGTDAVTVTVFVFPGVRLLDVTGPIEVFSSANEFGGRYRVQIASEDGAEVTTAGPASAPTWPSTMCVSRPTLW